MDTLPITRSPKGLQSIILSSGIFALIVILVCFWLLNTLFSWAPNTESLLKLLTVLFLGGTWIVYSTYLALNWSNLQYQIGPDSIIVQKKQGLSGITKTLYRYESIVKVTMRQGHFAKKNNYGDIVMAMPKVEEDIVLKDIDNPLEQLSLIQKKISKHGRDSGHLIN